MATERLVARRDRDADLAILMHGLSQNRRFMITNVDGATLCSKENVTALHMIVH